MEHTFCCNDACGRSGRPLCKSISGKDGCVAGDGGSVPWTSGGHFGFDGTGAFPIADHGGGGTCTDPESRFEIQTCAGGESAEQDVPHGLQRSGGS